MNPQFHKQTKRGFTILEVIAVMTIIGILAGLATFPILNIIDSARMRAEDYKLSLLKEEIRASFRQENMGLNISALPGDMTNATITTYGVTGFNGARPDANAFSISKDDWYARLTSLRGQGVAVTGNTVLANVQGDARDIAINTFNTPRVLLCGPYEKNQQRYLLMSFMFRGGPQMETPTNGTYTSSDYAEWFNRIYNHDWENNPNPPSTWNATWKDRAGTPGGGSYASRVRAVRIVQPRYRVMVNNVSIGLKVDTGNATIWRDPDVVIIGSNVEDTSNVFGAGQRAYVFSTEASTDVESLLPSGVIAGRSPYFFPGEYGILEGRRVLIKRYMQASNDASTRFQGTENQVDSLASLILSFLINENTTYTAQ